MAVVGEKSSSQCKMSEMFLVRVPETWQDTAWDLSGNEGNGLCLFSILFFSVGGKIFFIILCPIKVIVNMQRAAQLILLANRREKYFCLGNLALWLCSQTRQQCSETAFGVQGGLGVLS